MDQAEYEDAEKKICRYLSENYWHGLEDWRIEELAESAVDE